MHHDHPAAGHQWTRLWCSHCTPTSAAHAGVICRGADLAAALQAAAASPSGLHLRSFQALPKDDPDLPAVLSQLPLSLTHLEIALASWELFKGSSSKACRMLECEV